VPVAHEGNQSYSAEEVERVAAITEILTQDGSVWTDRDGGQRPLTLDDILIVAPYNNQVDRLTDRLCGAKVGTVDKFQGQEAPVVIYSMTTSTPKTPREEWSSFTILIVSMSPLHALAARVLWSVARDFSRRNAALRIRWNLQTCCAVTMK